MDEIDVAWRRIVAWCVVRAPATAGALRPPAGEAAVAAAREATDPDWPASLLAWYRLHGGVAEADERLAPVLGGYAPLTIEDVSGVYEDMLDASDLFWDHDRAGVAARVELPAGTDGGGYLPAFVPIASGYEDLLVCDLRAGPGRGSILVFDVEDMWAHEPSWPSLEAMLADVADALERGRPCATGWRPATDGPRLTWRLAQWDQD